MPHDYAQRRRVALALAITVIAAPAAFLLNRDRSAADEGTPTTVTLVGTVAPAPGQVVAAPATVAGSAETTSPLGTAPPGYLAGTTVPGEITPSQIAVPRLPESVSGRASYSSSVESPSQCHADSTKVPFNATVTVTNLDNSRSVQCVTSIGGAAPETLIVLATPAFAEIADLTDAPVPVQITWETT